MIPPGGWHYDDQGVRIDASTYEELVSKVEDFRAQNNLPVVDVGTDVSNQLCSRHPHFCHNVDSVSIEVVQHSQSSALMNDIGVWANTLLRANKAIRLVGNELAEERAKLCKNCPKNINWKFGCGSCIVANERTCASVRQARDTKTSTQLGGCLLQRHDNRTAVFLEKEHILQSTNLPSHCWLVS